jgi:hypothetical protein
MSIKPIDQRGDRAAFCKEVSYVIRGWWGTVIESGLLSSNVDKDKT